MRIRFAGSCLVASVLLASAGVFLSHCGNSSKDIVESPIPEGFFIGTDTGGGDMSVSVGSIDKIFFECDGEDVISPTLNGLINADLTFDVQFDVDSMTYRVQGQFSGDDDLSGTISRVGGSSPCNGPFVATRCGGSQNCNDTDGDKIPDEVDPSIGPPSTTTPGPTTTATPTGGATATPTSSTTTTTGEGGTTSTTSTSSTTSTTTGGGGTPTPSATPCPDTLTFEGDANNSDLDPGWTGQSHDALVIGDGQLSFSISNCAGSTRGPTPATGCGQCTISGPVANPSAIGKSNNQRCSGDTSTECTSDGDCTGKGTCEFFFGAPLPLSAGGVSTCVVNEVNGSVSGTVNIEAGSGAANISLISRVFNGILVAQPCPTCVGDPTPFDGVRGGTCNGGTRNGQACDISGRHPFEDSFGNTSFDCPHLPGANIANLNIPLNTSTELVTMNVTESTPKCQAPGFKSLYCLCSQAAGEPSKPNSCVGGATDCAEDPSDTDSVDEGQCQSGPFDQLCAIETFRGCSGDGDCTASGDTCTGGKLRECFTTDGTTDGDTDVEAQGNPDPPSPVGSGTTSNPTIVSLFCIGPTNASAVNTVAGLPGLGRLTLRGTATLSGP